MTTQATDRWYLAQRRRAQFINRVSIAALVLVLLALACIIIADDGMTRCQITHSFDVCHASLH